MFTRSRRKIRRNTRKFKGGKHTWKTRGIQAAKLAGTIGTAAYIIHSYTNHKMNKLRKENEKLIKEKEDDQEKKADREADLWNIINGKLVQEREKARQKREENINREKYEIREETKKMADEIIKNAKQASSIRVKGKNWW